MHWGPAQETHLDAQNCTTSNLQNTQAESFVLPVFLPYVGDFSQKRVWVGLPNQFNRPTSHVNYVRGTHFKAEMHSFPISIPSIHET